MGDRLPWTVESRAAASIIHAARSPWREESEARLRVLFDGGLSHAEMAGQLNAEFGMALTRNATIGKCHRMGLQRVALPGKGAGPRKSTKQKTPRNRQGDHHAVLKIVTMGGGQRVITSRKSANAPKMSCVEIECVTPFAEVTGCWGSRETDPPGLFCNGPRQEGSSYCTAHHAANHQPARPLTIPAWRAA